MLARLKKSRKYVFHALFLVFLAVGLLWLGTTIYSAAQLPIQRVKIEGTFKHVTHAELSQAALPFVQTGFFSIDVSNVKQTLQQ